MERFIPLIGILVIVVILLVDIIAHKRLLIRRRLQDWVFLCVLIFALIFTALFSWRSMKTEEGSDETGVYLAYRYLAGGDTASALEVIHANDRATQEHRDLIRVMAAAAEEDYAQLYFSSARYMRNETYDPNQVKICTSLNSLAERALKGKTVQYTEMTSLINRSFSALKLDAGPLWTLYFDVDKAVRTQGAAEVTEEDIQTIRTNFAEDRETSLLAISYYVRNERFSEAIALAEELVQERQEPADYSLLANLYMQQAYASADELSGTKDAEIKALLDTAAAAEKRIANTSTAARAEEYREEAEDARRDAALVVYRRVLNYLDEKQSFQRDAYGYLDLQKVKTELLLGEMDAAAGDFDSLIKRSSELWETSVIKEHLIHVEAARRAFYEAETPEEAEGYLRDLKKAVDDLISAHSLSAVPCDYDNVNTHAGALLYAMLRFGKPTVHFLQTDMSAFPEIAFTMDFSFMKEGIFGNERFYKDDITVKLNDVVTENYSMTAANGASDRTLAVVAGLYNYRAGTEEGTAGFECLQQALIRMGRTTDLARNYRLISSVTRTQGAESTGTRLSFLQAARAMDPLHEEETGENLNAAVELLAASRSVSRALVFLTDNAEQAMADLTEELLAACEESGISVYVLFLGDTNSDVLRFRLEDYHACCVASEEFAAVPQAEEFMMDLIRNRYVITLEEEEPEAAGELSMTFNELAFTVKCAFPEEVRS